MVYHRCREGGGGEEAEARKRGRGGGGGGRGEGSPFEMDFLPTSHAPGNCSARDMPWLVAEFMVNVREWEIFYEEHASNERFPL